LAACHALLTTWWDKGFPALPRVKPRRNALEWLGERAAAALTPADAASPQGQAAQATCLSLIEQLEQVAQARFEGEDSGLSSLRRALRELGGRVAPAATPVAGAPVASAGTDVPVVAPLLGGGPITTRQEAIDRLVEITEFFKRTEPHSPLGFLLARAQAWNSKSFEDVMLELLRNREDAQRQVFDDLGLKLPKNR
jgi:type VI secretion system protein ImpA